MPCRLAICDDESADRTYLSALVRQWAGERAVPLQVGTFASAEQFLFQYDRAQDWDILLLDIEMDGISGVDLAKRLRRENRAVQIVFVTGYSDYILEGYEVEALHYLMKPIREDKLFEVLDRAVERLGRSERTLLLHLEDGLQRVPLQDILWAEVRQNYVTIHADRDYTVKKTLSELEKELGEGFIRTGRSYLVNLRQISRVTRTEVCLRDGTVVPVSRGQYEAINRAIIQYF